MILMLVKTYKNYKELISNKNSKSISSFSIELNNYEYYKARGLNNFHVAYILDEE